MFHVLGEESRLQLIDWMKRGPHPVGWLAKLAGMASQHVSHHLSLLRAANLVDVQKAGKQRLYGIRRESIRQLITYLEGLIAE